MRYTSDLNKQRIPQVIRARYAIPRKGSKAVLVDGYGLVVEELTQATSNKIAHDAVKAWVSANVTPPQFHRT